jgi:hypothetical protein
MGIGVSGLEINGKILSAYRSRRAIVMNDLKPPSTGGAIVVP